MSHPWFSKRKPDGAEGLAVGGNNVREAMKEFNAKRAVLKLTNLRQRGRSSSIVEGAVDGVGPIAAIKNFVGGKRPRCTPMCWRLRPYVLEPATPCARGCDPTCCRPPRLGQRGADQDRRRQGRGRSCVAAEGQVHAATQLRRFRVDPGGRRLQAEYKVTISHLQAAVKLCIK